MMDAPLFTILLPLHRSPELLPFAVRTVQAQTNPSFELFIICDGAPSETAACARELAANDARIRVFDRPKGEHHGESHRHEALGEARGALVAQIGDDDLWFPDHLAELSLLLAECDFGNVQMAFVDPAGQIDVKVGDLAQADIRARMLGERFGFFGPTFAGYHLAAYRALPEGWSPAWAGMASDLFMWRKFLRQPLRFATRPRITALKLHASRRSDMSLHQRRAENALWAERIADPLWRGKIADTAQLRLLRRLHDSELAVQRWKRAKAEAGRVGKLAETSATEQSPPPQNTLT
jgi:glycosyltransferase involved in cell wall biosynthesis